MKIRVDMDECGDWYWLYADDELIAEGHSLPPQEWLYLLRKLGHETATATVPRDC